MTAIDSRRTRDEPTPDMSRSLGILTVSAAHLRHALGEVLATDGDPVLHTEQWIEFAHHLLETHDRIVAALATMRFSGSAAEHPMIRTDDDIVIPADAEYIAVLGRRMERHARVGRMVAGVSDRELQAG